MTKFTFIAVKYIKIALKNSWGYLSSHERQNLGAELRVRQGSIHTDGNIELKLAFSLSLLYYHASTVMGWEFLSFMIKIYTLYEAVLQLKSPKECEAFLQDLCTPAEINAMQERWRVAQLLDSRTLSYRDIHEQTGVSLATISRVARFLMQEAYQGYRLILDRIRH